MNLKFADEFKEDARKSFLEKMSTTPYPDTSMEILWEFYFDAYCTGSIRAYKDARLTINEETARREL